MSNNHSNFRLKHFDESVIILPLWEKKIDVSKYDKSTQPFDMEWVRTLPRLQDIELRNFDTLVSKRHKAETVCVYFMRGYPFYIHRRSTINKHYSWLIKVNEYNLEIYKAKLVLKETLKERKAEQKLKELAAAEQERLEAIKLNLQKEERKELDRRIKADKARIVQSIKEKYEKEKADLKEYNTFCMYHANSWLYGHAPESLRNHYEWMLAEQEILCILEKSVSESYDEDCSQ